MSGSASDSNIVLLLLFLMAVASTFIVYFKFYNKFGGSDNFLLSHLMGTIFGILTILLYTLLIALYSGIVAYLRGQI